MIEDQVYSLGPDICERGVRGEGAKVDQRQPGAAVNQIPAPVRLAWIRTPANLGYVGTPHVRYQGNHSSFPRVLLHWARCVPRATIRTWQMLHMFWPPPAKPFHDMRGRLISSNGPAQSEDPQRGRSTEQDARQITELLSR